MILEHFGGVPLVNRFTIINLVPMYSMNTSFILKIIVFVINYTTYVFVKFFLFLWLNKSISKGLSLTTIHELINMQKIYMPEASQISGWEDFWICAANTCG